MGCAKVCTSCMFNPNGGTVSTLLLVLAGLLGCLLLVLGVLSLWPVLSPNRQTPVPAPRRRATAAETKQWIKDAEETSQRKMKITLQRLDGHRHATDR